MIQRLNAKAIADWLIRSNDFHLRSDPKPIFRRIARGVKRLVKKIGKKVKKIGKKVIKHVKKIFRSKFASLNTTNSNHLNAQLCQMMNEVWLCMISMIIYGEICIMTSANDADLCFLLAKVCYAPYGCFTKARPFNLIWNILPQSPRSVKTKFHLYTRSHRNGVFIDPFKICPSNLKNRRTIFIVHGWKGKVILNTLVTKDKWFFYSWKCYGPNEGYQQTKVATSPECAYTFV